MSILLLLLLSSAFPEEPVVRKRARMPYPDHKVYDASVPRSCSAEVWVGTKGRPEKITALDCPEAIEAYTVRRLKRWRWQRSSEAIRTVVDITYDPPVEALAAPQPDYWRREDIGGCAVRVALTVEGVPEIRDAEASCRPGLGPVDGTPAAAVSRRAPAVCPVTFVARVGQATALDLFRCPAKVRAHARRVLETWTWPAAFGEDTPYSVLLQFEGPPSRRDEASE